MLTIIQSSSRAWAVAASNGDLHVYSREQEGEWSEVLLSEDSEQIDQDGSSILEALYEQQAGDQDGEAEGLQAEEDESDDEEEEPEAEGEPEAEEEPDDDEGEPEAEEEPDDDEEEPEAEEEPEEEEEEKPRRSRSRAKTRGRSK